jgi:hypothetical protein
MRDITLFPIFDCQLPNAFWLPDQSDALRVFATHQIGNCQLAIGN